MKKALVLTVLMFLVVPALAYAYDSKLPDQSTGVPLNTKGKNMFTVVPPTKHDDGVVLAGAAKSPVSNTSTDLKGATSITKTLSFGLKKDPQVQLLQEFLVKEGYLTATPDGNFGKLTLQAVKKFQAAQGISPIGIVGPQTRALIK